MTTPLSYTSSSEIATYITQLASDPSTAVGALLGLLMTRVSRQIDSYTKRRFFTSTALETKYFDGNDSDQFFPPLDIASTSGFTLALALNSQQASSGTFTTIDDRDYTFLPRTPADGQPFQYLALSDMPVGSYSTSYQFTRFPYGYGTIKTVGYFGWGTTAIAGVPDEVRGVATELVVRAWRGKDVNFSDIVGVQGLGTATFSRGIPTDLQDVLDGFTRQTVG